MTDGSYWCLRGDDDRLCLRRNAGVKEGIENRLLLVLVGASAFRVISVSYETLFCRRCSFAGADEGTGPSFSFCSLDDAVSLTLEVSELIPELDLRILGMVGISNDGTDDVFR